LRQKERSAASLFSYRLFVFYNFQGIQCTFQTAQSPAKPQILRANPILIRTPAAGEHGLPGFFCPDNRIMDAQMRTGRAEGVFLWSDI
jgi:hypothetical protein